MARPSDALARRARLRPWASSAWHHSSSRASSSQGTGGRPPPHQARRSREATSSAHASIRESDPQHVPVVPKAGCNMTRDGDGVCYPASYGSSNCAAHDLPLTPECTRLDEAERPSWCSKEWCYVDPANCAMPNQATEHFHVRPSGRCARPAPAWHLLPSASASRRAPDGHEDGGSQAWNLQLRSPGTGTHAYATYWRGPTLTVRGPPVAIPPGAPQAP